MIRKHEVCRDVIWFDLPEVFSEGVEHLEASYLLGKVFGTLEAAIAAGAVLFRDPAYVEELKQQLPVEMGGCLLPGPEAEDLTLDCQERLDRSLGLNWETEIRQRFIENGKIRNPDGRAPHG